MSSAFDLNRKDHGCILTLLAPDCKLGRDQGARSPLKRQQGEAGWNSKGLGLPRGALGSSSTESPWYTCRGYARAEAKARPTPRGTQGPQATAGTTAGTMWLDTQAHLGSEPLWAQIWDSEATALANTISGALGKVFRASLFILV